MTWLAHVKKTMKSMSGQKKSMGKKWFSHVLKTAKRSYHKGRRGGAVEPEEPPVEPEVLPTGEVKEEPVTSETPAKEEGGRRRRRGSKKTRRARKH